MRYLLDTYAWIEYFISSEKGKLVKQIIDNENNSLLTLDCNLAEIREWCHKNNQNFDQAYQAIMSLSEVQSLFLHDWISAAEAKIELKTEYHNFGMMDALILVKHRQFKGKLITGDKHFKEIKDVVFLE